MITLEPHPARLYNPVTGKKDIPAFPDQCQIMADGARIGYVSRKQGAAISLIRSFQEPVKAEIRKEVCRLLDGEDPYPPVQQREIKQLTALKTFTEDDEDD